jgi:hypothetical protein
MRSARSHGSQHLVQGVVHCGSGFGIEHIYSVHQNFERIARKHCFALGRQVQTDTSPIRLGLLSNQIPTCHKGLDGL